MGARWYDPALGRFTNPDPSTKETNPYLYAAANPCNRVDPGGTCSRTTNLVLGGAGVLLGIAGVGLAAAGIAIGGGTLIATEGTAALLEGAGLATGVVGTLASAYSFGCTLEE